MGKGHPGRAILIAGPTASGKSALALTLAAEIGGTIINADSMQVYSDLRVLTARPSEADMARVPHRLFGHVDAAAPYSLGRWLDDVRTALDATWRAGRTPVLVGGTGLYISGLVNGLSAIPAVPDEVRTRLRADAIASTPGDLHARLRAVDPLTASRLRASDPQRVLRALEVYEATGRPLALWQETRKPPLLPSDAIDAVFLDIPRADLNRRIDGRFAVMIENGAIDEVQALAARGLPPDVPAVRALGVAPLIAAIDGRVPLTAAIEHAQAATRRYAKRQITFARHQLPFLHWETADTALAVLRERWPMDAALQ